MVRVSAAVSAFRGGGIGGFGLSEAPCLWRISSPPLLCLGALPIHGRSFSGRWLWSGYYQSWELCWSFSFCVLIPTLLLELRHVFHQPMFLAESVEISPEASMFHNLSAHADPQRQVVAARLELRAGGLRRQPSHSPMAKVPCQITTLYLWMSAQSS